MILNSNVKTERRTATLYQFQKELEIQYRRYRSGKISEKEYLARIKPIDRAISVLEMATLQDNPVLRGSS